MWWTKGCRGYYLFYLQKSLWVVVTCLFVTEFEGPVIMDQIGSVELQGPWVGTFLDTFFVCIGEDCG